MPDPRRDQNAVRLRDLKRLKALTGPYVSDSAAPIMRALALMPDAERAEARAILERISDLGEPAEKAAARREILLDLARLEGDLQEVLAREHPLIRDGQVVIDPDTGRAVPDLAFERRAREELINLERFRSRLTGLPVPDEDPAASDA